MNTLLQDLTYGLRMFARTPVVTGVAVVSLALGITANAAMFAILDGFLLEPLPYGNADRLALLQERRRGEGVEDSPGISIGNYRDYVAGARSLEAAAVFTVEPANLTGLDVPEQLNLVLTTPDLFRVLGEEPALGRGLRSEDAVEGAPPVLVLDHDFWASRLFSDPSVLGTTLTIDGEAATIVGVMPGGFEMLPSNVQAFRPTDFAARADDRATRGYIAFGLLRPGATPPMLEGELASTAERLATEYPEANRNFGFASMILRDWFPGPTDTQLLRILTVVTLFGLLIACANVANLLLGRAEARQKEVALRTALGAGRGRVLRQLLTESVALAVAAGVLGVVLSIWVVGWLQTVMPVEMPSAFMPELDPGVLLATLALSAVAGLVFGLAPALHSVRVDLRESLSDGSRGGTAGRRRRRIRNAFVVTELAVALALLTGSGFMIEAFDRLVHDDPGFDPAGLLTFRLAVLEDRYGDSASVASYTGELVRALEGVPGVEGVAVMSSLPRGRASSRARYTVDGAPEVDPSERPGAGLQSVNPAYFATLGIPLLQGRNFLEGDGADAEPVAVVSRSFAETAFGAESPLGRRVEIAGASRRIVGVVGDILQERIASVGRDLEQVYLPVAQRPERNPAFALRARGDETALAADVRSAVWSVEPDQPLAQLRSLEAHVNESLAGPRAIGTFLVTLGLIALALAAIGIYGVIAHAVQQQQREIGIRMALGAGRGTVVGMVTRSGLALVGAGLLLGVPLAFLVFRGTVGVLGEVFAADLGLGYPLGLAASLVGVATLSTFLPARRASGVAPVEALRD